MMKTPTEFQLKKLAHMYDPVKAHEYYLRNRKLKGRKTGTAVVTDKVLRSNGIDPRTGKTQAKIHNEAVARQKKELAAQINRLEGSLRKLESKIREMEHKEASQDRKSAAKKERARKENEKPKTAAEKAEEARRNKKYRDKNQQKLKNDRKDGSSKSGGGSSKKSGSGASKVKVSDLKALATRVRGKIAVAKQKLAAL